MNGWLSAIELTISSTPGAIGAVVYTVVVSMVSAALWEWVRDTISIRSSQFINAKGVWTIASQYQHADGTVTSYNESLVVKQQFRQRFRGIISSPNPANPAEMIELAVRGEFVDKFRAVYSYKPRFSTLTDFGAGMLQVNLDHRSAEGASVNFGVSSPTTPAIVKFCMTKSL